MLFDHDPRYVAFLVRHPGIWPECGALDDKRILRKLRAERRSLGLPADRWRRRPRPPLTASEVSS